MTSNNQQNLPSNKKLTSCPKLVVISEMVSKMRAMTQEVTQAAKLKGLRILTDQSLHEDAETKAKLQSLIEDAKSFGCIEALKRNDHNVSYLTDIQRFSYLDIVEIQTSDDVLEIGSSMGQHTRIIAKKCRSLSAIEVAPSQAVFSRLWCNEDHLDNVEITAGGASGTLPYKDESFDLIIFNYVLEWCAGNSTIAPKEFHRNFLQEVFRVLRPSGRLFLSTKNRFSIRYILGSEDEHLGIRFGSALPRTLQKLFQRPANLGHPIGYLHSWHSLEKILTEVGFISIKHILAFPDARYPNYIGSFDGFQKKRLSEDAIIHLSKKNRLSLLLNSKIFHATSNSIIFYAKKGCLRRDIGK